MQRVFVSKYAFGHIFQEYMYSHWCLLHILLMHP